jgi:hypothetical protein
MNQKLQHILDIIKQTENLKTEEKDSVLKALKDTDKELEITAFKLERTEKVKKTTAILLEETIEELEQKRKAVEEQNRELEIETSLERVRAIAMGMIKSDDLMEVSKSLLTELNTLGFEDIRNTQIDILNDDKGSFLNYEYSDYGVSGVTEVFYNSHPIVEHFVKDVRSKSDALAFSEVTGPALDEWRVHRKQTNHLPDPKLDEATSLYYYCYSIGTGALGVSAFKPIGDEKLEVLKRFRNVFELAYRRFKDIQQAEVQTKEAKIEAALERVRSRTMAMHKSDELADTAAHLFGQLSELGIQPYRCNIGIVDAEKDKCQLWSTTNEGDVIPLGTFIPLTETPSFISIYAAWKKKLPHSVMKLVGKDRLEMIKYFIQFMPYAEFKPEEMTLEKISQVTSIFNIFNFKQGFINIHTNEDISEADLNVIQRFTNVFEQTYTRFLDLKNAEEQAREAQIEAALERVRARTMAMHDSNELLEAVAVFFRQFKSLGLLPSEARTYFCHINTDTHTAKVWMTHADGKVMNGYHITPLDKSPSMLNFYEAWKRKEPLNIRNYSGKALVDYMEFLLTLPHVSKDEGYQHMLKIPPERIVMTDANFLQGNIGIMTFEPLAQEALDTLVRFAKVFELTYTRFLDLQKAEAQAREAQIELGLERVRARTMAMHKSEELSETSFVLFEQLKELGEVAEQISIIIYNEEEEVIELYATIYGNQWEEMGKIPFKKHSVHKNIYNAWKEENKSFVIDLSGEELNDFNRFKMEHSAQYKSEDDLPQDRWVIHNAFFSKGALVFSTHEPRPLETIQLLVRFAGVFEQTYTRFLDLKKAETQAREAQIEAALERVRSRTMGMQNSEELKEVIQVVYEQFVHLNIHIEHTGFILDYNAKDDMHIWLADKHEVPSEVTIPYFDCAHWNSFNEAKEKGMDFFANHLTFEEKNKFYQDLFNLIPGVPEETLEYYFSCPGLAISTVLLENVGLYIENFSGIPYSDEENNTLMRFGNVFQQTYTRFLDLKQAEAQAREAQIEAALEKVRSRTMAMQKSDELAKTAYVLYEQFGLLGENPEQLTIGIIDETHKMWEFWLTLGGNQINHVFKASIEEPIVLNKSYIAWKERKKSIVIDISGDELKAYYNFFKNLPDYKEFNDFKNNQKPEQRRVINMAFFSNGSLSLSSPEPKPAETIQLLERFASVLEQTYTRFIDLQKAEEQAREAQIEVALERVRARTMAMHKSSELTEVGNMLFQQMRELGINAETSWFWFIDLDTDTIEIWVTHENKLAESIKVEGSDLWTFKKELEAWKNHEPFFKLSIPKKEAQTAIRKIFGIRITNNEDSTHFQLLQTRHKYGFLGLGTWYESTKEEMEICSRFAKVFEQTYTRFLDLKIAEEQAREAQIEAALERVRASAMAMHSSEDLAQTVDTFFSELNELNVTPHRCGVGIIDEESRIVDISANTTTHTNNIEKVAGKLKLSGHPVLNSIFENWKLQKEYHPVLRGKEILDYYKVMNPQITFPDFAGDETQYGYYFYFKEGGVFAWTDQELAEGDLQIFRRYTSVLSLTYRRYIDLKDAEAQAREAKIEVALERVRSKTMAMHQSDELAETAVIVFKQLIDLGIAPNRLYIGIIKDTSEEVEFWITDEDGTKVSQQFTGNISRNLSMQKMYDGWKSQKKFVIVDMQGDELKEYFQYLSEELHVPFKQGLSQKRRVQNIAYFTQGFIGIASPDTQPVETIDLLKRFAAVFNLTYTRFNDLQQAEAQNKIIEAENKRKTEELEEARKLQLSMLPKELPQLPDIDIEVYMQTATEVGGDYYDFKVGLDGTLITVIGDATGHGMKAGTVVTITKSLFNSMAANENILSTFDNISQVIKGMKFRQLAMCLIMMKIKGNRLSMSSAAMPPILIYRTKNKTVEELLLKGMPLGTMKKFPYKKIESHLNSGDRILLYSDGLPELANNNDEMFGYDRIKTEFHSVGEKDPEEIVDHLKNSASQWANGKEPDDDVTFVVIKMK